MSDWLRKARRKPLFEATTTTAVVDHDRGVIGRLLRHRGPMLLLDRIVAVDLEQGCVEARRTLRNNDPAFDGHFPDDPVYPGSFQVEMMGQLGLTLTWFLARQTTDIGEGTTPPMVRLIRIEGASFVSEARPGDELTVRARCLDDVGFTIHCAGQLCVGERIVSACTFEALVDEEET